MTLIRKWRGRWDYPRAYPKSFPIYQLSALKHLIYSAKMRGLLEPGHADSMMDMVQADIEGFREDLKEQKALKRQDL